jgi:hypothetical protein
LHGQIQPIKSRALVVHGLANVGPSVVPLEPRDVEAGPAGRNPRADGAVAQRESVSRPSVRDGRGVRPGDDRGDVGLALHAHQLPRLQALEHRLV